MELAAQCSTQNEDFGYFFRLIRAMEEMKSYGFKDMEMYTNKKLVDMYDRFQAEQTHIKNSMIRHVDNQKSDIENGCNNFALKITKKEVSTVYDTIETRFRELEKKNTKELKSLLKDFHSKNLGVEDLVGDKCEFKSSKHLLKWLHDNAVAQTVKFKNDTIKLKDSIATIDKKYDLFSKDTKKIIPKHTAHLNKLEKEFTNFIKEQKSDLKETESRFDAAESIMRDLRTQFSKDSVKSLQQIASEGWVDLQKRVKQIEIQI